MTQKIEMKLSEAIEWAIVALDKGKVETARAILNEDILPTVRKEEEPGGKLA